jgi:hypothetical protein
MNYKQQNKQLKQELKHLKQELKSEVHGKDVPLQARKTTDDN